MRTNFLLLTTVLLLISIISFTSCVKDDDVPCFKAGTSSLTFTLEGITTRAATNATKGYDLATADEVKVNDFYVGFYRQNGTYITSGYYLGTELVSAQNEDGKATYTVNDILVPMNENITVYVVANASKDYGTKSLSDLKKELVSYTNTTTFMSSAGNLIKVGQKDGVTFSTGNVSVEVELVQLAAKIHLTLEATKSVSTDLSWAINGVNAIDIFNGINNSNGNPYKFINSVEELKGNIEICQGQAHGFDEIFKTSFQEGHTYIGPDGKPVTPGSGDIKWLTVKCDSTKTENINTWVFVNPTVIVNNIVINSSLDKDQNASGFVPVYDTYTPTLENGVIDFSFYTYKKEYTVDEGLMMSVSVDGSLQSSQQEISYIKKDGYIHGVYANAQGVPTSGWGNGSMIIPANSGVAGFAGDWEIDKKSTPVTGNPIDQSYYTPINPEGGFQSGNYYNVTGTLKVDEKLEVTIDWKVKDITSVPPMNIPDFK